MPELSVPIVLLVAFKGFFNSRSFVLASTHNGDYVLGGQQGWQVLLVLYGPFIDEHAL